MDSFNDVWEKALSIIRDRITITSYESWIKLLRPIRFENDTAYIYAQSNFQKVLINNKFKDEIERALSEAMGFDVTAVILSEEDVSRKVSNPLQIKDAEDFKFEEKDEISSSF